MRANLDAFWSRQPTTAYGNSLEVNHIMKLARDMQIDYLMHSQPQGPFPTDDSLGMVPAILSLQRSLNKGCNSKTIQWDTMRGIKSGYFNAIHNTPAGIGGAVLLDGQKSMRITNSPSNVIWFQRFMGGCHERMADVRIPDTALTIDVLLELDNLLEALWQKSMFYNKDGPSRFELATTGCMLAIGFSSGL
ncbi:hypothetical protein ACA910_013676 [Epithemia clementina (nom. ined.)]